MQCSSSLETESLYWCYFVLVFNATDIIFLIILMDKSSKDNWVAEVKPMVKLRSEILISWFTISPLDCITLFLEMAKYLRAKSAGFETSWTCVWICFPVYSCGSWISDLTSSFHFLPFTQSPSKVGKCELMFLKMHTPKKQNLSLHLPELRSR